MKKKLCAASLLILLISSMGIFLFGRPKHAEGVTAGDWSATRITDDAVFFKANTLNPGDIQNFLNAKVPTCDTNGTQPSGHAGYATRADWSIAQGVPPPFICLRDFTQAIPSVTADAYCNGIGGGTKSAADIIFNVAQACNINPEVLIVLLQKEQTLVSDDWPWPVQYRSATGYGCPDTAACDTSYYGFFNQVYNAGRQFRRYITQPDSYNFAVGRTSFVGYNPSSSCGGTNLTLETQATAALYNYTPYQPNQAALNNLYGSGDSCSAYGNRNFWRLFSDWFGSTKVDSFTVALSDNGSGAQFLLFGGIKQAIPDPETKIAWGIQSYPLVTMPASYLATIPSGPYLDRLTRLNTSDSTVFFMDGGKRYRITSQAMLNAWNLNSRPITNVPPGLFYIPTDGGELTYTVKNPANATLYMVDGANSTNQTILRPFQSDTVRKAWEGDNAQYINISNTFFDTMNDAIGSTITTTKLAYGGSEYQALNGAKFQQPLPYAYLYPGVAQAVSAATFNRLANGAQVSQLVRAAGTNTVYILDNGTKRALANPSVLASWTPPGSSVEIVNGSYISLIPDGAALATYTADVGGQLYVMNTNKLSVPVSMDSAYRNALPPASVTAHLTDLYPLSTTVLTGFLKGATTPQVYLLDNSGKKRHIEWPDKATLLGAYSSGIILLPDNLISSIPETDSPQTFVSDGTTEYLIENGTKHPVTTPTKTDWGLSGSQVYSDGTLTRFPTSAALTSKLRDGNSYYLVKGGRAFLTVDINVADTWAIDDAPQMNQMAITSRLYYYMLTRFVRSTTDNRIFVVDNGNWYNLSNAQLANLGGIGAPMMGLEPTSAPNSIIDWTSIVVKDSTGKNYVIDNGTKRSFQSPVIQNQWTGNGTLVVPTVTNGFLNLLPNNGTIERAIKGSSPAIYSAESASKRHILYSSTYNTSYAPYATVSDTLLNALATGSDIQ